MITTASDPLNWKHFRLASSQLEKARKAIIKETDGRFGYQSPESKEIDRIQKEIDNLGARLHERLYPEYYIKHAAGRVVCVETG